MPPTPTPQELAAGQDLVRQHLGPEVRRWLLVATPRQRLWLLDGEVPLLACPVSTAAAGLDARQDSGGTPPGLHAVARKVGEGEPRGMRFVSRRATGQIWTPGAGEGDDDLILSRVLVLDGLEPGRNRGPGVDSRERYIYLHGTNHERDLGRPVSGGCVRLGNDDIIDLFARVEEGDPLVII